MMHVPLLGVGVVFRENLLKSPWTTVTEAFNLAEVA